MHELPPHTEELRTVGGFSGRESQVFFKGIASGRLIMLHWVAPHPGVHGQHTPDSDIEGKRHDVGGREQRDRGIQKESREKNRGRI